MTDDLKERLHSPEGHDEPCYYCGEPVRQLAADPSLWPLPFCHQSEPGVVKWHHTGCVTARLDRAKRYREALKRFGDNVEKIAFEMEAPNAFTPLFIQQVVVLRAILQESADVK